MASQPDRTTREGGKALVTRESLLRALTFWLRPAFALRLVNRFQRLVGFDRSMALASSAFSAVIPLVIVSGVVLARTGSRDTAHRIIDRYRLTGGGAEAVQYVFSPSAEVGTGVGVFGLLFLAVSLLSFSRAVQRLFEHAWELPPLSVRNTVNGLRWIGGLLVYLTAAAWLSSVLGQGRLALGAAAAQAPLTAAFLMWSGRVLSAKRVGWWELLPFGLVGAVVEAAYSVGAAVYLPRLFSSSADQYGAMGAVFALVSALFGVMFVLVCSAVAGREVRDELDRIARGERPADDEVRREWDQLIAQTREKWQTAREQLAARRPRRPER
ncbi:YhjD/YihY/BrkB family envelope integrity protein [Kitasatospora sp. NPDC056446]|uniref:YhjD/YihY/BrkB family envelope integrity protein n=1 Tax=Kitasatospora sp. NPDC056446 TaxID=3345819 RepID=UPI003677AC48